MSNKNIAALMVLLTLVLFIQSVREHTLTLEHTVRLIDVIDTMGKMCTPQ